MFSFFTGSQTASGTTFFLFSVCLALRFYATASILPPLHFAATSDGGVTPFFPLSLLTNPRLQRQHRPDEALRRPRWPALFLAVSSSLANSTSRRRRRCAFFFSFLFPRSSTRLRARLRNAFLRKRERNGVLVLNFAIQLLQAQPLNCQIFPSKYGVFWPLVAAFVAPDAPDAKASG